MEEVVVGAEVQVEYYLRLASLHLIVLVFLGVDRVSRVVQVLVVAALLFCCLVFVPSFRAVLAVATHVLHLVENVWLHLQRLVLDDRRLVNCLLYTSDAADE